MTGTKIQVPNAHDPSIDIIVMGTKDAIEKAVHEIQLISDEQVHVEFTDKEGGIRLEGPPEQVETAREKLVNMITEMQSKLTYEELYVDPQYYKHIIGKSGSNINRIRNETSVLINISELNGKNLIRLEGSHQGVLEAKQELKDMVTKLENEKERDIIIENRFHRNIIGTKGETIKEIREKFNQVQISFPDQGGAKSDVVKIRGPKDDVDQCFRYLQKKAKELAETNYQLKVSIVRQFHKFIIGKGGSNINKIREETNTRIELPSEGQNSDDIIITGRKENCEKARERIQRIQSELDNIVEVDIMIPGKFHNAMIGAGGKLIQSISEDCGGVSIKFPPPDSKSDKVTIRGPKDDVQKAKHMLIELSNEKQLSSCTAEVRAKPELHRFIIGRNGANIRKIRDKTGARITFPTDKDENKELIMITGKKDNIVEVDIMIPGKFHNTMIGAGGKLIQSISEDCGGVSIKFPPPDSKSDKVTIRGPKDDVQKAKHMLIELSNEKQLFSCTAEVRAKPELHRFLIGRNGANIRKIRDKTGARITFPTDKDENKELIMITGKKDAVEKAQSELKIIIQELDKVVEEVITVDPKYHRHFVARRGEVLRQISEQYGGVTISFPRQGIPSDKVTLKGIKECVDSAKGRVKEIVFDLEQMIALKVNIPQKYHRTVMGARGIKVQGITSEFDVQIKFPEKDFNGGGGENLPNGDVGTRPQDLVLIQGKKENCEAAKNALLALVPVVDDLPVSFKYHRFIIGQKGETVRELMREYDVNIQVPPAQEQKDSICITGPLANVEAARLTIEKKVQELIEEEEDRALRSFQLHLKVDPEYHPKIIGRKGTVISKIREKYDVNIQFPARGGSEDDLITISGYEKNCEDAKEAILDITGDLDNMVRDSVVIDSRIHSRLIGARGRAIRKIMDEFKVRAKPQLNRLLIGRKKGKTKTYKHLQ